MEVGLESLIGTELAGYRIEALLGRGGMSVVYRAEDLALGRKVALKLMSPELSENDDFRDRFRMEWRLAASIDHPNVIPIYEAGDHDGQLFIAMRYVEGTDLKALLEAEGALESDRALSLVSQAAEGLDAAHNRGLVHRDVKPSNVLISREGDKEHAYLADFGLTKPASTAEEARESIQLSGTTDYVSPEQIADGTADASSDIYALGALLYESLTGEVPYPRDRKLQVLFAHINDPPPTPTEVNPELPEAIDAVIATAMAKEPEDRYASGAEIADAATAAFPIPKRPWWQLAALVGVLALLIAAAIAIPAILLTGGLGESGPGGTTEITPTSIQRIDPENGELAATIPLESDPDLIGVGEGSVWVIDTSDRLLVEVDPESNSVVDKVSLEAAPSSPVSMFVGAGGVWTNYDAFLVGDPSEAIWVYDPTQGSFAASPIADGVLAAVWGAGHGDVWGTPRERVTPAEPFPLVRVPPSNPDESIEIAELIWGGFMFTETDIWVHGASTPEPGDTASEGQARAQEHLIWRIDPQTNEISEPILIPGGSDSAEHGVADESGIWWSFRNEDMIRKLDLETMRFGDFASVRNPEQLAVGGGAVWVTNSRDSVVFRIDKETLDVETIELGGIPKQIAAYEDSIWVTVRPG